MKELLISTIVLLIIVCGVNIIMLTFIQKNQVDLAASQAQIILMLSQEIPSTVGEYKTKKPKVIK